MSEQKIAEFRERATTMVAPADPDQLLERGRALRRRRQLAPVVALAACAAVAIGIVTSGGGDSRSEAPPVGTPTITPTDTTANDLYEQGDPLPPGEYPFGVSGGPDATAELVGEGWRVWDSGAHLDAAAGTVSLGIREYHDIHVDRCSPDGPQLTKGLSRGQVVRQVSRVAGTQVTSPPSPATMLGLTGTHLQVSVPWREIECPTGTVTEAVLMASWDGPKDPTVTVDVWVLEDGDRLLMLTKSVRGNPSPAQLEALETAMGTLSLAARQ
jgi:hypothetical protein